MGEGERPGVAGSTGGKVAPQAEILSEVLTPSESERPAARRGNNHLEERKSRDEKMFIGFYSERQRERREPHVPGM